MKKRNIGICILLSIITCGIYKMVWLVDLVNEVNYLSKNKNAMSGGMCLLFNLLTCGIYGIYWAYVTGNTLDKMKSEKGIHSTNSGILYIILSCIGLKVVVYAIIQDELNKEIDEMI